ncbi:MAG TPA: methyltransferase domain-containing protein [Candidatus Polarisedimenticolaceae bacterium]|nr:methyltransferase domain-containing protein [Candidatus Polarisedimenticolaceae bacterium]
MFLAILLAAATAQDDHATVHHAFDDVPHWVAVFDDPARDAWQKPEELLRSLGVEAGETVADLGAGTGYLSVRIARAVGSTGKVLAIDVEPKLVAYMKERAAKEKLPQMHAALIKPDDPGLPEAGVDLVIVVDTWHHIDERVRYLAKVARGLKADGRVAVVDFKKGSLPVGPPDAHKLAPEQIVDEFKRAGWSLVRRDEELLPYQYLLVFARPRS